MFLSRLMRGFTGSAVSSVRTACTLGCHSLTTGGGGGGGLGILSQRAGGWGGSGSTGPVSSAARSLSCGTAGSCRAQKQ